MAHRFLLDTNIVSHVMRHPQGVVAEQIEAVGERQVRQSAAEPPSAVLQRYPGSLAECFTTSYRDARQRARAQAAFYGSMTISIVTSLWIIPAVVGGSDGSVLTAEQESILTQGAVGSACLPVVCRGWSAAESGSACVAAVAIG